MEPPEPRRLDRFPRERAWLLPALDAVQRAERWVSPAALRAIAAHLRVPLSEVWGVATHYPEIRLTEPGRRLVRVCTGVSCRISGALDLVAECERRLAVRAGATTADGGVTLEEMDCAFACGVGPVVEVDHRRVGRVRVSDLEGLLEARGGAGRGAGDGEPEVAGPPSAPAGSRSPAARYMTLAAEADRRRVTGRIAVALGTCGRAVHGEATYQALLAESARRRLPVDVRAVGCGGMCWAAPSVQTFGEDGRRRTFGPVTVAEVPSLLDALSAPARPIRNEIGPAVFDAQKRVLLDRCGVIDPLDVADAVRHGGYAALAGALERNHPERVIEEIRTAGLEGRGGAYFQTAVKWAACRAAAGAPKFIVVNGEEGEPGIVKDRHLMEGDPHALLEGLALAAFAIGASRAILYVHGEADLSADTLRVAVAQARAWGLLGPAILGSSFSLEVEIRRGLGGFVLGEETALLESIEGWRAMPRTRPPFPVQAGLWGQPTVINNVETLSAVPRILERGGAWFASLGRGYGTKLFGLSGHVRRPGVVEVELGVSLRTLVEHHGGGSATGRPIIAAVVGGPSGSVVHPRDFGEPLVPRGPVNPGTGGVVVLDAGASVPDVVRTLLAFNSRESCGKCTPCREGTARLLALLDGPVDVAAVRALAEVIQVASLCGLGQAAPYAVLSGIAGFPEAFGRAPEPRA